MGGFDDVGAGAVAADPSSTALVAWLARHLVPGGIKRMSERNNSAVAPILADLLKGRNLPEAGAPLSPADPAMQRLIMRTLAQQGGAAFGK